MPTDDFQIYDVTFLADDRFQNHSPLNPRLLGQGWVLRSHLPDQAGLLNTSTNAHRVNGVGGV
jgi:hypothetical protein